MKCIYCSHPYTYQLNNGQRKCSSCKRKFSVAKIKRRERLHAYFLKGTNAHTTAKLTGMHVATVNKYFQEFRKEFARLSDISYQQNTHLVTDYDEYLYLPKSLDPKKNIGKIKHFLTLAYGGKVYNLMMPSIERFDLDLSNKDDQKLLEKYLKFDRVAKLSDARSTITDFWDYFENFILHFKGVSDDQFIYYLKEAEWRFNAGLHINQNLVV